MKIAFFYSPSSRDGDNNNNNNSKHQSHLQFISRDNLILLAEKFGHVPIATDVTPSQPCPLLLR
jgi:hypothetical protein